MESMNIFIYSDESGVFDAVHNDIFVFGGLIFTDKESRDLYSRKYTAAERNIQKSNPDISGEIKAAVLSYRDKHKLFKSLSACHKFGVIVKQKELHDRIFSEKKSKQRYLDYAYKIAVKRAFEQMIRDNHIVPDQVEHIYFFVDEHTTATNGRYELKESLLQELLHGTFNYDYNHFYPPIFPKAVTLDLEFCNSESKTLVRAADIIANKLYHLALENDQSQIQSLPNMHTIYLPR